MAVVEPGPAQDVPGLNGREVEALWARNRAAAAAHDYAAALPIWKQVQAAAQGPVEPSPESPGTVAVITARRIKGWSDTTDHVVLTVNGRAVYRTAAVQTLSLLGQARKRAFSITLSRLWRYLGAGDGLEVTDDDGQPLHIAGLGPTLRPWLKRKSRTPRLFARLDEGFIFNKWGRLQKPLSTDTLHTGSVMALFETAADAVEAAGRPRPFIFYGTLLGAVRDHDFIAHDDDIDALYLCRASAPEAVRDEFLDICRILAAAGFHLRMKPFGAKVLRPDAHGTDSFGLHYGWVDDRRRLHVAYGHHGPHHVMDGPLRFRPERLGAHTVAAPAEAESMLAMLYTEGWRTPDPGFSHRTTTRKHSPAHRLTEAEQALVGSWTPGSPLHDTSAPSPRAE